MIGCGEVRITMIKLGPLICLMPIGMEHCGEHNNERAPELVNGMICASYFILDVEMQIL
jgi:hypothetical protein